MARITLALAAALAAAVLLALAAAPASAADAPTKCPPGCATCEPYTPEELAAKKAAHEAREASERAAGKAARDDCPSDGGHGNWTHGNWTKSKCLTCNDATYMLKKGHCVCVPGYGIPLPDPATFTPGQRPRGPPPACAKCPAGTASGPDAPKPDWCALKAKWQAARAAAGKAPGGGRKMLAENRAAGMHGKLVICVPCPSGKSNGAGTACL